MTPVDHRPYAGPTDLVTAEDVAEWLRERAERALDHAMPLIQEDRAHVERWLAVEAEGEVAA